MYELLINGGTERIRVNMIPDFCPICNVGIDPSFVTGLTCSSKNEVDILFKCPKTSCKKMFIASYNFNQQNGTYNIKSLLPRTPKAAPTAEEVTEISPQFAEIYNQAFQAEAYGLGEVAGVGYRKSLEYLIKDYCTAQHPDKDEDIKKRPIAQVIEAFVSNENIKQCAKRAIWLGNDETHYVRKWEGKDIKDLKLLIQITVSWIQQEVITKKLLADMQ
ncbi:DUF4145 domain-containing protein [Pseudomonas syringae]|uniref:DUF4145 domain-containing protein n=1 Tax=Pseudomonas syringae TaxID=317 RepID=UPI001BCAA726|nr:DUF4145 domain-containing protein [Pseudomonas syringae]MBS7416389.1 DUF4145 domain-containing protein [Pseudomonas syringae]